MSEESTPERRDETPVIEGPSATTDPGNADSGPTAYVVFAIAVALLALLVLSLTNCVSALGTFVATHYDEPEFESSPDTPDEWDWEHDFDEHVNGDWDASEPLTRA